MPCEAAKEFGVFGHAAHVNLKEGKTILERGELLKELFLSELLFRQTAFVFVLSVDKTFHDDAPLCWVRLGHVSTRLSHYQGGARQLPAFGRRLAPPIWRSLDD
jgi:hypothetical protein